MYSKAMSNTLRWQHFYTTTQYTAAWVLALANMSREMVDCYQQDIVRSAMAPSFHAPLLSRLTPSVSQTVLSVGKILYASETGPG